MRNKFIEKIRELQIEELAIGSNFYFRKPRKITATNFVSAFFMMMQSGKFSLKSWAFKIFHLTDSLVSHQSVAKKLGFSNVNFAKTLFERALLNSLKKIGSFEIKPSLSVFSRILIEDSTCFKLPKNLFPFFPGSSNQAKSNSMGKIQLCIDICNNIYSHIHLSSFRDTDAKYAFSILDFLKCGDLVLRDLGYWNTEILRSIQEKGAFFVSRLRLDKC